MRRGRTAPVAVALTAALALAGCADGGAPERGRALSAERAAAVDRASAAEPTAGQSRVLARAEQILISRCMAARGLTYAVTEPVREEGAARSFPYGVDDVDWARAHGYGGRAERAAAEARAADPNQLWFHRLPARERAAARTALMGASPTGLSATAPTGMTLTASTDGCIARAQRTLYGDLPAWFRVKVVTMNLRPAQEERVRRDARYAEAVGRWAACMAEAGRPYASPADSRQAAAALAEGLPPDRADTAETALAVTEATCATSSGLGRVSQALDRAYGEEVRTRHQDDITLGRRLQNAALPTAERVVSQYDRTTSSGGSRG
ncbi:hypothetical protein ABZ766_11115 [Streptomyces sp. NPDC006670]|uniref:hypothetical protein n=1 Tax=Streptomyces sp. NPDC006670 TaxID=3154476 RepID=UPI0033F4A166